MDTEVTVKYSFTSESTDRSDYTAVDGSLTFAPGETFKLINFSIADDKIPEREESFTVRLLDVIVSLYSYVQLGIDLL